MVSEAQRQRDNGQGRIDRAAGREDRASGYVEIGETVHAAVLIDDAERRIQMHPRRAHMMLVAVEILRPGRVVGIERRAQPAETGPADLGAEQAMGGDRFFFVSRRDPPVDGNPPKTEGVAFSTEKNPAVRVWQLRRVPGEV